MQKTWRLVDCKAYWEGHSQYVGSQELESQRVISTCEKASARPKLQVRSRLRSGLKVTGTIWDVDLDSGGRGKEHESTSTYLYMPCVCRVPRGSHSLPPPRSHARLPFPRPRRAQPNNQWLAVDKLQHSRGRISDEHARPCHKRPVRWQVERMTTTVA